MPPGTSTPLTVLSFFQAVSYFLGSEMRQLGESVVKILGQYQEQPNLLDPHLEVLLCRPAKSSVFDATPFSDWFIFFLECFSCGLEKVSKVGIFEGDIDLTDVFAERNTMLRRLWIAFPLESKDRRGFCG